MAKKKNENRQGSEGSTENQPSKTIQQPPSLKLEIKLRQRDLPFISMGIRFRVNVEALNMVETAGNLTKHRVVPIVVYKNGKYSLKWYPALSGETLAHAIQANLALLEKKANGENAKLCYFCSLLEPEFIKHTFLNFFYNLLKNNAVVGWKDWEKKLFLEGKFEAGYVNETTEGKVEETLVKNCIVEDIGGFLITKAQESRGEKLPGELNNLTMGVRRTSAFQVSYAIPTEDSLEEASMTDIQMQVRMAPTALSLAQNISDEDSTNIQTPYNKEIASTTYSFIFNFDADRVGVSAITNKPLLDIDERKRRAKLLLDALKLVLDGQFGASKSRYYPFINREFVLAAVSKGDVLFTVSSPAMKLEDFIEETIARAVKYVEEFGIEIKLYAWIDNSFNKDKKIDTYIKTVVDKYVPQSAKEEPPKPNSTSGSQQLSKSEETTKIEVLANNVKIGKGSISITVIVSRSHADLIEKLKEEIEGKQDQNHNKN